MNRFSIDSSYVILINDNNSMVTTIKRTIMQYSNLVDVLCFLVHRDYAESNMKNFSASLQYRLPVSMVDMSEDLVLLDDTYENYLLYTLPIDTELTTESGDVYLSLTFSRKDIDENGDEVTRIRKVSGAKLRIEGSSSIKPVPGEYKRQVLFVNALPAIGDRECVYVYMNEFYLWNGSEYICTTDDNDDLPISGWEPNKQLITDENGNLALGDINGINISSSAKEGQTIIVKKTDEHGNPVEWECADASIFGSKSEFVIQADEPEDTSVLWIDLDDESDHAENIDLTGYATERYVQNYAQPKGDYLTEHQDISGKLDASELPTAINTVLAQAKESGEFDGPPGADGQPGKDGSSGKDGTSVTVKSVSESTADGGSNVVTFSDGTTLTVKNGKTGAAGKDGADGNDYVLTSADKEEIANIAAGLVEVPENSGGGGGSGGEEWVEFCSGYLTEPVSTISIRPDAQGVKELLVYGNFYMSGDTKCRLEINGRWTAGKYTESGMLGKWNAPFVYRQYFDEKNTTVHDFWIVNGSVSSRVSTDQFVFKSFPGVDFDAVVDGATFETNTSVFAYYKR